MKSAAVATCPECAGTREAGELRHGATCPIDLADQAVLHSDRERLAAEGFVGYERPIADAERAKRALDGAVPREGALVAVTTLWVNGAVVNPRMVTRHYSGSL